MADKVEEVARSGEAAAYRDRREQSFERAKTILSELLDAARSAAETILEDQKQRTAERVSGMAEGCAARLNLSIGPKIEQSRATPIRQPIGSRTSPA